MLHLVSLYVSLVVCKIKYFLKKSSFNRLNIRVTFKTFGSQRIILKLFKKKLVNMKDRMHIVNVPP